MTGHRRIAALLPVLPLILCLLLMPAVAHASGENGTFEVQAFVGGGWRTLGSPSFGLAYSTQAVDLGCGTHQVRLVQHGGTAAQLDAVLLDGVGAAFVSGGEDALAVGKLAADDDDVTDAFGRTLVLHFPAGGSVLTIDARIQGDISGAFPFEYPTANTYSPVAEDSAFYPVDPARLPRSIDTGADALVREYAEPGTGHPAGFTYVWLANDGDALLAAIDFTADNTMDGDEDYATVHVRTASGLKDYRVSAGDSRWGDVAFTYTDKVPYQHKIYRFRIPWSELGETGGKMGVAFTTYGTAATYWPVFRFYNMRNDTHFYTVDGAERNDIITRLGYIYRYDGVAYVWNSANTFNDTPLRRYYNKTNGSHIYTIDPNEIAYLNARPAIYSFDGIAYTVCDTDSPANTLIYRLYNKLNRAHLFTADGAEANHLTTTMPYKWVYEGVAFELAP